MLLTRYPNAPVPAAPDPAQQRTRSLLLSIEAQSDWSPEQLALQLLLPEDYQPEAERHAVLPTAVIQLWLEGRVAEAALTEIEEQRVLARARQHLCWHDPVFVSGPPPASGATSPPPPQLSQRSPAATAAREEGWRRLREDLRRGHLPPALLSALDAAAPASPAALRQLVARGRLRELNVNLAHENRLRSWLRLPLLQHKPRQGQTKLLREFTEHASRWERTAQAKGTP